MTKKHTYVECHQCAWRLADQRLDRDWVQNPCHRCNNTRSIIDPKELLCNMCGEGMCHEIKKLSGTWQSAHDPAGLYNTAVTGGYESYHLFDMTRYTFSFCEKCLRHLFMQCKIKPDVASVDFDDNIAREELYHRDQESYEYRVWQDAGGHHQSYLERKCNFVKDCPNRAEYTQLISKDFTEGCCCEEHKTLWNFTNSELITFIPNILKPFL